MKSFSIQVLTLLSCTFFPSIIQAQNHLTSSATAQQWLVEAKALYDSSQYVQAEAKAAAAYRFFQNDPASNDLAEAAFLTGQSLSRQGKLLEAIPFFEESAQVWALIFPKGTAQTADALHYVAVCLYYLDKSEDALVFCLRAYEMRKKLPPANQCELSESLRQMGNIYIDLGRYAEAIQSYEEALPYEKICSGETSKGSTKILGNLGYAWNLQGDIQKSIAIQEQTLAILQKISPVDSLDIANTCHKLGLAYKSLGKSKEALEYLEKALEIRQQYLGEVHIDLANSYSEIGRTCFLMRDFQKALFYFNKENDLMIRLNATSEQNYSYLCADMGQVNLALKNYPESVRWHEKTVQFRRVANKNLNSPLASALVQLGNARLANGDAEGALSNFYEAKQIWETLLGPESFMPSRADAGIAYAYRQQYLKTHQPDLLEKSRSHFQMAAMGIEKRLKLETSTEVQKKVLEDAVPLFSKAISTEWMFMKTRPYDPEALEKAWQLSESMHSYLLFSATQESNAKHFTGISDGERSRDSLLHAQIIALEKKRRSLIEGDGRQLSDSLVLTVSLQISAQYEAALQLETAFEKNYPDYFRLKYDLQTSSLVKTQQLLSPQQTLLEYFTGDSSIFVFVVQHEGTQLLEIKRDFPLEAWVHDLREGISGYHTASEKTQALYKKTVLQYADTAEKLYSKLLAPIEGSIKPELIVVPGDGFNDLPFEALLSGTPNDLSNFKTYPFFLQKHSVQYAYSATMLHEMSVRKHLLATEGKLLAFAPFFEEDTTNLALRLLREGAIRQGLSPLPFSGEEVLRAKNRFGGKSAVLTGKAATKQKFQEMAGKYQILHLATHGKANHLAGDFSFLAFSSPDEVIENGLISVAELYNLPLNADLVLLSACETGIGEQQRGEGVVSLARAFAYAGAKSVIASLWSVNDQSTMLIMDAFYKELKSGKSKDIALTNAKRQYLKQNPGQAHPFYWAGFVSIGDPSVLKN